MGAITSLLDLTLRVLNVALALFLGAVLIGAVAIVAVYAVLFVVAGGAS